MPVTLSFTGLLLIILTKYNFFKTVDSLLLTKTNKILPRCDSSQVLANYLEMFFINKVDNICTALNGHRASLIKTAIQ